jgi:glutathione S-transferase
VPAGDARRGLYFKWLFFGPACLEQAIIDRLHARVPAPARASSYGDYDTVMDTIAAQVKDGLFLVGEHFTAADVVLGSGIQWGTFMKALPERPEFTAYLGRLMRRPALQRAFAKNKELYAQLHPAG